MTDRNTGGGRGRGRGRAKNITQPQSNPQAQQHHQGYRHPQGQQYPQGQQSFQSQQYPSPGMGRARGAPPPVHSAPSTSYERKAPAASSTSHERRPPPAPAASSTSHERRLPPAPAASSTSHERRPAPAAPSTSHEQRAPAASGVQEVTEGVAAVGITGRGGLRLKKREINPIVVTRPENFVKIGNCGDRVLLRANYFKLLTRPKWVLYQYRVDISPLEERTVERKNLLRVHKKVIGSGYIFDGTVLYTPHRIQPDPLVLHSERSSDNEKMTLTIKLVGDVTPYDYAYIQVFNLIMRKCYGGLKLQLLGRDFYDRAAKIDIPEYNIQIWPGYKTTIAQHEQHILMVAEISHKIVRTDTVLHLLNKMQRETNRDSSSRFNKEIIGQIILTDYNNKTYRVDDVNWKANPQGTFPMNGENISYLDYYKKKYNITIRDYAQPLLVSLSKTRDIRRGAPDMVLLVPELCRMTGITDKMRSDYHVMRAISSYTRVGPEARQNKLMNFNHRLSTTPECVSDLREWDMSLDRQLVEINARILPQEYIVYDKDRKVPCGDTFDGWTKSLRSAKMLTVAKVTCWAIIAPQWMQKDTQTFVKTLIAVSAPMGLNLPEPDPNYISSDQVNVYVSKLEEVISSINPTFVLCVLTNNKSDLYNAIKKKCSVDRAVPSQVVVGRSLTSKTAMSIATKIAIQINCKIGGTPWTIGIPLKGQMFVGYDVCHDPRNKKNSFGAMIATLDDTNCTYYSTVSPHTNGEELATEFSFSIKNAVQKYFNMNNTLPKYIFIYRDGVGEGQLSYVFNSEVEIIKSALNNVYNGQEYGMQFIIVSKRLNTRLFAGKQNPKPGTVVDDVITSPEKFDFFLVSQCVREGTVAPTSYNVLFNSTSLNADKTQRLAYKMCHLYYNFAGQVRVPAVCHFAHKLAFLASQNLHHTPHENLSHLLHFL